MTEERCPEQKTYGDVDFCTLEETVCVLMGYSSCDIYEGYKEEWLKEEQNAGQV